VNPLIKPVIFKITFEIVPSNKIDRNFGLDELKEMNTMGSIELFARVK